MPNLNNRSLSERLAVCSWSLQPADPQELVTKLRATGLHRLQLALDPLREAPATWGQTAEVLAKADFAIVSGMFGCVGEDYSTLETIRITGGIAPDATWTQNLANIKATAALAVRLGLKLVTFHAGFIPHNASDPNRGKMLERLGEIATVFQGHNLMLGLETGQEAAPVLVKLLESLARPNVTVNFDPANMLLYDKGDPVAALKLLGQWLGQVHIKDARRTRVPGTWGEEVPAGTGEVKWQAFFQTLNRSGFRGDLVIEREAGNQRVADIRTARDMVERLGAAV
jgi:sugar phosphate isomerase/epimerase